MHDGLRVIQIPGAYGRAVTRVGWLRRVRGDEWVLLPGAMTVVRTAKYELHGLDSLASDGLGKRYKASEPSKQPEEIHRLLIRRSIPAVEAAWAKLCPKPTDWPADGAVR